VRLDVQAWSSLPTLQPSVALNLLHDSS
jgi:hypothetical protein